MVRVRAESSFRVVIFFLLLGIIDKERKVFLFKSIYDIDKTNFYLACGNIFFIRVYL